MLESEPLNNIWVFSMIYTTSLLRIFESIIAICAFYELT